MRRELSAGGVVVRRMAGRLWFAAIRPRRDDDRVVWALPKGLIDAGESPRDTAVREVREETGLEARIDIRLTDSRYVYTWDGERVFKIVTFFLLHATGGRIGELGPGLDLEVAEARWFPLEDATTVLTHRGERHVAAQALAVLVGPSGTASR